MKQLIFGIGYAVPLLGGMAASLTRALPVQNTAVFLLGLLWTWNGLMMILGFSAYGDAYHRSAACKRIHGFLSLAMGATWGRLALTPYADQAVPMLLASVPFILPTALAAVLDKRKRRD